MWKIGSVLVDVLFEIGDKLANQNRGNRFVLVYDAWLLEWCFVIECEGKVNKNILNENACC